MTPLWAAILIGLAGGVIGTLFTIGHERGAEFRTRMLTAADEHMQSAWALTRAGGLFRTVLQAPSRPDAAALDSSIGSLHDLVAALDASLVRIYLLYGENSATWRWGVRADKGADAIIEALIGWRLDVAGDRAIPPAFIQANHDFSVAMDNFATAARRDVRFGIVVRLLDAARGRRAPKTTDAPTG